jgi:uncharacterized membrane protein
MLTFGSIVDPGYKIALFFHVVAVVVAFGPTFAYALILSVAPQYPRATPAILEGVQRVDRYLVNPGMVILLVAGIVLLASSGGVWDGSQAFIIVGFIAIIALFGMQHGYFQPAVRKAKEIAERDVTTGDALSPEFETISRQYGQIGTVAGVVILVTIFFMVYKPFL